MPKYTKEELAEKIIVVKCNNKKQADYIVAWAGKGVDIPYQQDSLERIYFRYYSLYQPDFSKANPNEHPQYTRIDFSEQFPEYQKENKMKTKYTLQELKDKKIAIRCDSQEEADKVKQFAINGGEKVNGVFSWIKDNPFFQTHPNDGVFGFFCNAFYNYSSLPASEFFLDDKPEPIPTEYAVLTNATEAAKKQIAEFEQALAQIKIDAMKLSSRDLAQLIKALKGI